MEIPRFGVGIKVRQAAGKFTEYIQRGEKNLSIYRVLPRVRSVMLKSTTYLLLDVLPT